MVARRESGVDVHMNLRLKLKELHTLRFETVKQTVLARAAGYESAKQPGFVKVLSILKSARMIEYTSKGPVCLSERGMHETPSSPAPRSNTEALLRLQQVLGISSPGGSTKLEQICQFLSDGQRYTLNQVAAATGYNDITSSGFIKVISTLVSVGLLVRINAGTVMLADVAFLFNRPVTV